jgi:hypothetical protein
MVIPPADTTFAEPHEIPVQGLWRSDGEGSGDPEPFPDVRDCAKVAPESAAQ